MKIRRATKGDILKIWKVMGSNNPKYPQKQAKKEIHEMFSKSLIKPVYLVAEENGEILSCGGFIRSWVDNTVFNIFWVNTQQEYQGRGIGTKLIKEIIKTIKTTKENPPAKMITLSTNKQKFYEKLGFKKLGKEYGRDYVLMGKVLK